jgi:hypothetical protein
VPLDGGDGGEAIALLVADSPGALVEQLEVSGVFGGTGGPPGGRLPGLDVDLDPDVNGECALQGGRYQCFLQGSDGNPGDAYGAVLLSSPGAALRRALIQGVRGGVRGAAVRVVDSEGAELWHLTAYATRGAEQLNRTLLNPAPAAEPAGVWMEGAAVTLTHSILSETGRVAVETVDAAGSAVSYTNVHSQTLSADLLVLGLQVDSPRFVQPGADFHLSADSPCVDAGDPALECGAEPGGDACVLDLGYYGGSAEANARPQ